MQPEKKFLESLNAQLERNQHKLIKPDAGKPESSLRKLEELQRSDLKPKNFTKHQKLWRLFHAHYERFKEAEKRGIARRVEAERAMLEILAEDIIELYPQ